MDLKGIGKAAWPLAGGGVGLILVGLIPTGSAGPNLSFWISSIGFDRLADVIPAAADMWVIAIGLAAVAVAGLFLLAAFLVRRGPEIKRKSDPRRNRVEQKLLDSKWLLVYDPQQNLSKSLSFNADGTIGEGRNWNEHTWAVSGNYVDIFRESGILHNRFELHASGDRLNWVREPRAMGTRNQCIQRVGRKRGEDRAQRQEFQ